MAVDKRVVVIGGNGFIGRNVCKYIKNSGKRVTIFDCKEPNNVLKGVEYIIGNCNDERMLSKVLKNKDVVIHLASTVVPETSMKSPFTGYNTDIIYSIKILDQCIKNKINRVVFASSGGTVYGNNKQKDIKEDSICIPINHYGITKLSIEKILLMYNQIYGMSNIVLRLANPYGIGQSVDSGVGAIAAFTDNIINNKEITIFGDGTFVRDYVSIEDVSKAFNIACDIDILDIYPVFNIGSGQGISINELVKLISDVLKKEVSIRYLNKRKFDVVYNVLNIEKAKKYLGYLPEIDIKEGLRDYIYYVERHLKCQK